jgi:segregation and condensation protein B
MPTERTPNHLPRDLTGTWHLDAEPGEDIHEVPILETEPPVPPVSPPLIAQTQADIPPSPEQLIEAMLFVGGHPLAAETACSAIRGLTADRFHTAVDVLSRQYRRQQRPYTIQPRDDGFVLAVLPTHRGLRERLFGGPREARLGQLALDVLSVVAYRQPVGKAEVDAIRGTDSGTILRHLVRLGLVAVQHRAEAGTRAVRYGTTSRFLQVFGLASLDELPRLGDTAQV